ncbi:MAG: glycosyltransferase family 2 protein [Planctomycetes bacterium]|nr:glycosyltransferase family 2 protein [Planctomycetota bacterium]
MEEFLVGIPVFNEVAHVEAVLFDVLFCSRNLAVVDDGSTDGTSEILDQLAQTGCIRHLLRHEVNQGYGRSLADLLALARREGYDCLVTLDADEQHYPGEIPGFVLKSLEGWDIVSGTRYALEAGDGGDPAPPDRLRINRQITARVNALTGYGLTDAFCGFKAYGRRALEVLRPQEPGYGMPLELWIQAARAGLRVQELPVRRIYQDTRRSFGGRLDDPVRRLEYYESVLSRALQSDD